MKLAFPFIFKFLLLNLFVSINVNANEICEGYQTPKTYIKIQKDIDKRIEQFANKKSIAAQADHTLSKLIEAKSKVLAEWIQKRNLNGKSDKEIVKAWRLYYARTFILMKYPQEDENLNEASEKLVDEILKKYLTKQTQRRLEKLFKKTKTEAIATVKKLNLPIRHKESITARLKAIKLYWPKNLKTARNNAMPLDLVEWGIAYDPVPNEINIGVQALAYPGDETFMAVFAHEMGHSMDSCRWGAFFKDEWTFQKVGECLRSPRSVQAKTRDDAPLEQMLKEGKIKEDFVKMMKSNPTCNKISYLPSGAQADQLNEAFADWFSTEVMARMKKINVSKLRQDLCEEKTLQPGSSYPSNQDRLQLIYRAHPNFQSKKNLSSASMIETNEHYCEL